MPAPSRYSRLSITLHWLTLLLIGVVYSMAEFKGFFPRESATAATMRMLHSSCGLTILALTLIRVSSRLFQRAPDIATGSTRQCNQPAVVASQQCVARQRGAAVVSRHLVGVTEQFAQAQVACMIAAQQQHARLLVATAVAVDPDVATNDRLDAPGATR